MRDNTPLFTVVKCEVKPCDPDKVLMCVGVHENQVFQFYVSKDIARTLSGKLEDAYQQATGNNI